VTQDLIIARCLLYTNFSKIKFKKNIKKGKNIPKETGTILKEQQDQSVTYCDEH
jgi:hypothetical protein